MNKLLARLKTLDIHPALLIIAGAVLVIWPNAPWDVLIRLIGIFALIWGGTGLWQVFSGSKKDSSVLKNPSFLPSCAAAAVGVWMLCNPRFFEGILPVIIGIAGVLYCASILYDAVKSKKGIVWYVLAAAGIIFSLVIVFHPIASLRTVTVLLGILLVYTGVTSLLEKKL